MEIKPWKIIIDIVSFSSFLILYNKYISDNNSRLVCSFFIFYSTQKRKGNLHLERSLYLDNNLGVHSLKMKMRCTQKSFVLQPKRKLHLLCLLAQIANLSISIWAFREYKKNKQKIKESREKLNTQPIPYKASLISPLSPLTVLHALY